MQAKKHYTDEFKKEAIHLLETSGKTVTEIERELGISHGLLRKWQKRFQVNPTTSKLELNEVEQLKVELRHDEAGVGDYADGTRYSKKTVGIFSKDHRA